MPRHPDLPNDPYKTPQGYFNDYAKEVARHLKIDKGLSDKAIARQMGISRFGARRLCQSIGFNYAPWRAKRWTPAERQEVEDLRDRGWTARQIGEHFGVTRNSVIGIYKRAGLCQEQGSGGADDARRRRMLKKRADRIAGPSKMVAKTDIRVEPTPIDTSDPPYGARPPLLVKNKEGRLEANSRFTETSCKWPLGDPREIDFGFCGRPRVIGSPYCGRHTKKARISPKEWVKEQNWISKF